MKVTKKVKSIQMFKKPVDSIIQVKFFLSLTVTILSSQVHIIWPIIFHAHNALHTWYLKTSS